MEDAGGKSGRRPGRHLQVEASGPGNARPANLMLVGRFRRGEVTEGCAGGAEGRSKRLICLCGARLQSRCGYSLCDTWMRDTGGKSGRRSGRHLQVEASGPRNAASVQQRLAGRFGWRFEAEGWFCGARLQSRCGYSLCETCMRDTGGKSGRRPGRHLQVEASGPRDDTIAQWSQWRLAARFRGGEIAQGRASAAWPQVDAPELSLGPGWEIQEVSRVGAQGPTSKSMLLAEEMPRVCSRLAGLKQRLWLAAGGKSQTRYWGHT